MKHEMRFIPESSLLIFRGNFEGLLEMLHGNTWRLERWLGVALWMESTGKWYIYDREDFEEMAEKFLFLKSADQSVSSFEQIFDIHEWKGAPKLNSTKEIASNQYGSLVTESDLNTPPEQVLLTGAWIPMRRKGADSPPKTRRRQGQLEAMTFSGELKPFESNVLQSDDTPRIERRTPHVDFSPEIPVFGEKFKVEVYADTAVFHAGESGVELTVKAPAVEEVIEINAWLSSSNGLRVISPAVQPLQFQRDQPKTTSVIFEVDWVNPSQSSQDQTEECVMVVFSYASRPCGWVRRTISPGAESSKPTELLKGSVVTAPRPDMTVTIVCPQGDGAQFQVAVECPSLPEFQSMQPQPMRLAARSEDLMRYFISSFSASGMSNEDRRRRLDGVGQELYDLAPKNFKSALGKLTATINRPLTILVVSEEPDIPWELMIPPDDSPLPLGARHIMGRWTSPDGRPTQQHLRIDGSWIIAPDYRGTADALSHQEEEAALVEKVTTGSRINPATIESMEETISANPKPLLHFVGHGAITDGGMAQALLLDGAVPLLQLDLRGMRKLAQSLRKTQSLVFLNACQVGQPIRSLTGGSGGLAATFLGMGAGAVIAPLWSVRDEIAHTIAEIIYKALPKGELAIPELLRKCRARAYEKGPDAGEDTFAAYCFYGDPCLVVKWNIVT